MLNLKHKENILTNRIFNITIVYMSISTCLSKWISVSSSGCVAWPLVRESKLSPTSRMPGRLNQSLRVKEPSTARSSDRRLQIETIIIHRECSQPINSLGRDIYSIVLTPICPRFGNGNIWKQLWHVRLRRWDRYWHRSHLRSFLQVPCK